MMKSKLVPLQLPYDLRAHNPYNLIVDSQHLNENPLGDSSIRHNYLLVPKKKQSQYAVIFHLSGFFSTGFQNFHFKTLEDNFVQSIDIGVTQKKIPQAIHVFVDASTFWGGSQFINSEASGLYADYILQDIFAALKENFKLKTNNQFCCVMGASSGGYGALALVSETSSPFGIAFACAPDSYFEASLLPELLEAAPELLKYKKLSKIKEQLANNELQDKKSFFNLINVLAMTHCYSEKKHFKKDFIEFPIDLYTGEINIQIWQEWLEKDPLFFLKKRLKEIKDKEIYLDVGIYDNFSLQYGTRQIHKLLIHSKVDSHLTEFSGNHFGLKNRKLLFLEKLNNIWGHNG
jgi:hypothetical protein